MQKDCSGCGFKNSTSQYDCLIYTIDEAALCPCKECLVKPICGIMCIKRRSFFSGLKDSHRSEIKRNFMRSLKY